MADKRMDLNEFREAGYLQELNRRFLHPLGLHLDVVLDARTEKVIELGAVWDHRDQTGGCQYGAGPDPKRVANIDRLWAEREPGRVAEIGSMLQPVEP